MQGLAHGRATLQPTRWYENETLPKIGRVPLGRCKTDPH